ncbi:SMP-30/gluconolactonase/LRE family protein [Salipiger thiooxidans]|uniref:SMP-30/gluconolactonase/LRE family protein n=1 Tax=Salipiger thiooxidans TaxID=282683 RepID=UPI001A902AC6|nr:SMP-30/gluconolactonase/LRE family protein [Salipiger thiooxidans]MBN8189743.1 SMP-30/gluconolactonase/LRE family protein [Salipiger thiooxidans]
MTYRATLYDDRPCELGEGPLWHPERQQLFWFDIAGRRLLSRDGDAPLEWRFDEHHSAAGWVDRDTLLVASETGLWRFDIESGERVLLQPLEDENEATRSNDGRADPMGGFWIGTMGKGAEPGAGAIYRWYRGELRQLMAGISVSNSICFAPDGRTAYFADTPEGRIWRQPLDAEGWPSGEPAPFADPGASGLRPDGSVTDAEGALWNAAWGAGKVTRYGVGGEPEAEVTLAGSQSTCPAFGGPEFRTMFVTTAREGLTKPDAGQGCVYAIDLPYAGRPEPRVLLP